MLIERFGEYAVPDMNFGDDGMIACFFLDDEPTGCING